MKRLVLIFSLLILTGLVTNAYSQSGGRKREHRNQKRGSSKFKNGKSAGNADAFARGGRRGKSRKGGAWVYRPTPSSKKQNKEQRFIFTRYRTKGKKQRHVLLTKQNNERAHRRVRGNKVFHKRKF